MRIYILFSIVFYCSQLFSQTKIDGVVLAENPNGKIKILSKESDDKIGFTPIKKEIIVSNGLFKIEIEGLSEIPRPVRIFGTDGFQLISKEFYIDKDVKQIILVETEPEKELDVYISPFNKNQIDYLKRQVFF